MSDFSVDYGIVNDLLKKYNWTQVYQAFILTCFFVRVNGKIGIYAITASSVCLYSIPVKLQISSSISHEKSGFTQTLPIRQP